ncbi:MAG: TRAP transporter substrate-binding protein DctP [Pseudomonadota bacterium]
MTIDGPAGRNLSGGLLFLRRFLLAALALWASCASIALANDEEADAPYYGRAVAFAQPGSVWHQQWMHFKANVDEAPDLDIAYYIHGELGGEEQMLHDLRRGRAHIGGMALQGLASTVPELTIAMAPFLFDETEEVDFIYDEYLFDFFNELFAEKGLRILQWVEVGWTNIYTNGGKPILTPADAAGRKLRGSPNISAQYFLDAVDADMIPLSSADLVPALQTGLVQGGLSSTVFHFFVTRRYSTDLTLTRHSYDTGAIVVNKDWYDATTPAQRETLSNAWMSSAEARAGVRDLVAFALMEMEKEGIVIHTLTPEVRAEWKAATADKVARRMIAKVGGRAEETYARILEGKRAYAAMTSQTAMRD